MDLLFTLTLIILLMVAEGLLRVIYDPVDYLLPIIEEDALLQHRIPPGSGGHDEWGFRNKSVPRSVDIVAIGDSQTYGISAKRTQAWPAVLGKMSGHDPVDYLLINLLAPASQ